MKIQEIWRRCCFVMQNINNSKTGLGRKISMKTRMQTTFRTMALLLSLLLSAHFISSQSHAAIVGPYTANANTLVLFHLNEAPGGSVTANAGSLGGNAYTCTNGIGNGFQITNPPPVTDMLGAAAYPGFGYCCTNTSSAGYGNGTNGLVGYDYNNDGKFQSEGGPLIPPGDGVNTADDFTMNKLNMGNGSATPFTIEAMICPLATNGTAGHEIVCTDSGQANRGLQFKLVGPNINFNPVKTGPAITVAIPKTGPNAYVTNALNATCTNWYHIAATYDGSNVRIYWTAVNATNTIANLISTTASTAINNTFGVCTGAFVIGNNDRNNNEGFLGRIGEVRISKVCLAANQMLFANTLTITAQPLNASAPIGGTATFSVTATTDYSPLYYQWRTNGVAITNGTDGNGGIFSSATTATLQIANVQAADVGYTYDCVITNSRPSPGPDGTNTTTATLTIHTPLNLAWRGTVNLNWDNTANTNWFDTVGLIGSPFMTSDNVTFDNTGTGNPVSIPNAVQPGSVTVSASSVNYTFTGNGKITGTAGLTKNNGSTLTIQTTNDYTGVTTLNGGIVSVGQLAVGGNASAIGAASSDPASLVFNGGDLQYTGPTVSIDRGATLNASGGTLEVTNAGSTLTLGGLIAGTSGGGLTKLGAGTLALSGTNTYNGLTTVSAGTLQLNGGGTFGSGAIANNATLLFSGSNVVTNNISGTGILTNNSGTVILSGNNTFSGNIYISANNGGGGVIISNNTALGNTTNVTIVSAANSTTLYLAAGVSTPIGTTLVMKPSNAANYRANVENVSGGAGTWNGPIFLQGDGTANEVCQFQARDLSSPLTINGNVTATLADNLVGQFDLYGTANCLGVMNGTFTVNTNVEFIVSNGALWTLNSSGNTCGFVWFNSGKLTLGANNALPVNVPVQFGGVNTVGTLDLAGHNQQVGGLTNNASGTGAAFITNSSATSATLTYSNIAGLLYTGPNTPNIHSGLYTNFSGSIGGNLALTMAGGTLTMSGVNTYSGATTISSGKLALTGSGAIANSTAITVASGGTLDASARTGGTLTLSSSQTLSGSGTVIGTLAVASGSTVASGNSTAIGTLTNTGSTLLQGGGASTVKVQSATTGAGVGNASLAVSANIGVLATSGSQFTVKLVSLDGTGAAGDVTNFDNTQSYTWTIATGTVTNFSGVAFTVDTSGFANSLGGGQFFVGSTGSSLVLLFNPSGGASGLGGSINNPGVNGGGNPTFSGQGIPGYTYGVESATNLITGPWIEAGSVTAAGDGSWSFTDIGQTNPGTIFYRLYYPDNPGSPPQ